MKTLKITAPVLLALSGVALLFSSCKKNYQKETSSGNEILKTGSDETFVIDGDIITVKNKQGVYYISDDQMISEKQFNILKAAENTETDSRATVTTNLKRLWPNGVVYYRISDEAKKEHILNAMAGLSAAVPALKFAERTNERNYCDFVAANENSSYVGMIGGRQTINLFNNQKFIIQHEICHALGIDHEQNRPDRDKYIQFDFNNVEKGVEYNFQPSPGFKGVGEFDFKSIMLYDSYAFSINGNPVITKLDGSTFSGGTQLSAGDIMGLKSLYGGNDAKPTDPPPAPPTPPTPVTPPPPVTESAVLQTGKTYVLIAKVDNRALDLNNNDYSVIMNTPVDGKSSQQWIASEVYAGVWAFESAAESNTVLEISNEGYLGYNKIKANTYRKSGRQLFTVVTNSDKTISIKPYFNPYYAVFAVKGSSDGNPVILYKSDSRYRNQKFTLVAQH